MKWLQRAFFVCLEQKLNSRFGKERLNNIWQAQVPPQSVQPSLPRQEGNLAAPGKAMPTLAGVIHSVSGTRWISWACVWIHRFHAKRYIEAGYVQVYLGWKMNVACEKKLCVCACCLHWLACTQSVMFVRICSRTHSSDTSSNTCMCGLLCLKPLALTGIRHS